MAATTKTWVDDSLPQAAAADMNGFKQENNLLISSSGQALNTSDNDQTSKAVSIYAAAGDSYNDTGIANAYVLSTVGNRKSPGSYVDGMKVRFVPANSNDGAATNTINVDSLGVKNIKDAFNNDLTGGSILNGVETECVFSVSLDRFTLTKANPFELLRNAIQFKVDTAGTPEGGVDGLTFDTLGDIGAGGLGALGNVPYGIFTTIVLQQNYTMSPIESAVLDGKQARIEGVNSSIQLNFPASASGSIAVKSKGFLSLAKMQLNYDKKATPLFIEEPFYCENSTLVFTANTAIFLPPTTDAVVVSSLNATNNESLVLTQGGINSVQFFGTTFVDDGGAGAINVVNNTSFYSGDIPNVFIQYSEVINTDPTRWVQTASQINEMVVFGSILIGGDIGVTGRILVNETITVSGNNLLSGTDAIQVATGNCVLFSGTYTP